MQLGQIIITRVIRKLIKGNNLNFELYHELNDLVGQDKQLVPSKPHDNRIHCFHRLEKLSVCVASRRDPNQTTPRGHLIYPQMSQAETDAL